MKNNAALVRGGSADPDALRDLLAYADAYGPVADELDALAHLLQAQRSSGAATPSSASATMPANRAS